MKKAVSPRSALTVALAFLMALPIGRSWSQSGGYTVEDFNRSLIKNGVVFNEYNPSFYTGFAPRVETPSRIHLRIARGNQARVTAVLDEQAVLTYLYGLRKRYRILNELVDDRKIRPLYMDTLSMFKRVIESPAYDILGATERYERGAIPREQFYALSLETMERLNPGRVRRLKIDLGRTFEAWRSRAAALPLSDAKNAIVLANDILPGRLNIYSLTPAENTLLADAAGKAQTGGIEFRSAMLTLLRALGRGKYDVHTLRAGRLAPALQCGGQPTSPCTLEYPEFTSISPVGTVKNAYVPDGRGNNVPDIRNQGVWNFKDHGPKNGFDRDVDNIRMDSPYYGYIPKMDWESIHNGVHNPAVRKNLNSPAFSRMRQILDIPGGYNFVWAVARGGVSNGCIRMPSGHVWELRHVLPTSSAPMTEVHYFGNRSADYDLFDIDGNGKPEVMGVDYLIAYSLVGAEGLAKREGKNLVSQSFNRDAFYNLLYGEIDTFRKERNSDGSDRYVFMNPSTSYHLGTARGEQRATPFSVTHRGDLELHEEPYEREKLQFYSYAGGLNPRFIRLLGRISGCGPFAREFPSCGEAAFDREYAAVLSSDRVPAATGLESLPLREQWSLDEQSSRQEDARRQRIQALVTQVNRASKGPFGPNSYQYPDRRESVADGAGNIRNRSAGAQFGAAFRTNAASQLAALDFYVGNLFTTNYHYLYAKHVVGNAGAQSFALDHAAFLRQAAAGSDALTIARHMMLEAHFARLKPTSGIARGHSARGVSHFEDELPYYRRLVAYIASRVNSSADYLTLFELQRRWNFSGDAASSGGVTLNQLRADVAVIADRLGGLSHREFWVIRNTIHNLMTPAVGTQLDAYLARNPQSPQVKAIRKLRSDVAAYYANDKASVSRFASLHPRAIPSETQQSLAGLRARGNSIDAIADFARTLGVARVQFERDRNPETIHFLVRAIAYAQKEISEAMSDRAEEQLTAAQAIVLLAYSSGMLNALQKDTLLTALTRLTPSSPVTLARALSPALGHADAEIRSALGRALTDWVSVEPLMAGIVDDTLKSSPLNELSILLTRLQAQSPVGARHVVMNDGEAYGTLVYISRADLASESEKFKALDYRSIPIFEALPIDLGVVAGIVTEEHQTPLSHVNIKSNARNTPNLVYPGAARDPLFAPHIGKLVRLSLTDSQVTVEPATQAAAQRFWASRRPTRETSLAFNLGVTTVKHTREFGFANADSVGSKAANYAELVRILPEAALPALAIPYFFYDQFIKRHGIDREISQMLADRAFFEDRAYNVAKLEGLRERIMSLPVQPELTAQLERHFEAPEFKNQKMRFRSSTNSEDLPNFSGAGLYSSTAYVPGHAKKTIERGIKTVWASVWNQRAFDERELFGIRHLDVRAAVLVSPSYDNEEANGVAVTRNKIGTPSSNPRVLDSAVYYNTQKGEDAVTNPTENVFAEESLVYFSTAALSRGLSQRFEIRYLKNSSLSPNAPVLTDAQVTDLTRYLLAAHVHFARLYGKSNDPSFAIDAEFKLDDLGTGQSRLYLKQARPFVE